MKVFCLKNCHLFVMQLEGRREGGRVEDMVELHYRISRKLGKICFEWTASRFFVELKDEVGKFDSMALPLLSCAREWWAYSKDEMLGTFTAMKLHAHFFFNLKAKVEVSHLWDCHLFVTQLQGKRVSRKVGKILI